jgi:polyhydroxyalkanoate synthase subunit PhaC
LMKPTLKQTDFDRFRPTGDPGAAPPSSVGQGRSAVVKLMQAATTAGGSGKSRRRFEPTSSTLPFFAWRDVARRAQAKSMALLGFSPHESPYCVVASRSGWRLRSYGGADGGAPLLIVAAPIKRPYIWDLMPSASAVGYCLARGFRVYLLEWCPPHPAAPPEGLAFYGDCAIGACVRHVRVREGVPPLLLGHSLGGTLAGIFACLHPRRIRGLVLLGAPLSFGPGSSAFRDSLVALHPMPAPNHSWIPGSALSQLSALASPESFVWPRIMGSLLAWQNINVALVRTMVEQWALDEVGFPGPLAREIWTSLYLEDRLCRGCLRLNSATAEPAGIAVPTLAVINKDDKIAPRASVVPFLERIGRHDARLLEHKAEPGIGLPHVTVLVGPEALAKLWPLIGSWIDSVA